MEANSSDFDMSALASGVDNDEFQEDFAWDWYIRLKVQFPVSTETDLSPNLNEISKEYDDFWQSSFTKVTYFFENLLIQYRP
jgi:hypothetical protein